MCTRCTRPYVDMYDACVDSRLGYACYIEKLWMKEYSLIKFSDSKIWKSDVNFFPASKKHDKNILFSIKCHRQCIRGHLNDCHCGILRGILCEFPKIWAIFHFFSVLCSLCIWGSAGFYPVHFWARHARNSNDSHDFFRSLTLQMPLSWFEISKILIFSCSNFFWNIFITRIHYAKWTEYIEAADIFALKFLLLVVRCFWCAVQIHRYLLQRRDFSF